MTPRSCSARGTASPPTRPPGAAAIVAAAALAATLAAALAAAPVGAQPTAGRGFLFKEPRGTVAFRLGYAGANARSDIFSFATEQLTLGRGDFNAVAFGAEFAYTLAPRLDATASIDYGGRNSKSEFRDWVDNDDKPIEQHTGFERAPLTVGLKAYVLPRGRSIGRYAWVPSRVAPFVAGGGGLMWFRFRQVGDFIDFKTKDVFPDEFASEGWSPTLNARAGVDVSVSPHLAVTGQYRYDWARGRLARDFKGFDPIDLSGFSATLGITIRY